jgi:hypothetical protein
MTWEYERKEVHDKRLDAYLAEKGKEGWELAYVRRGKETRVNRDPDLWEVIFKRPKSEPQHKSCEPTAMVQPMALANGDAG